MIGTYINYDNDLMAMPLALLLKRLVIQICTPHNSIDIANIPYHGCYNTIPYIPYFTTANSMVLSLVFNNHA